jgi:hypothetical protein
VEYIVTSCPKHRPPNGEQGLVDLDPRTPVWLTSTELKEEVSRLKELLFSQGLGDIIESEYGPRGASRLCGGEVEPHASMGARWSLTPLWL